MQSHLKEMTEEIMTNFLAKMTISIVDNDIPRELVANFDETGLHLTPAGSASYVKIGDIQVKKIGMTHFDFVCIVHMLGFGDKRQITGGLGASWNGDKMGIQLIFAGKTQRCLPKVTVKKGAFVCFISSCL
jgi:hypothetical protein